MTTQTSGWICFQGDMIPRPSDIQDHSVERLSINWCDLGKGKRFRHRSAFGWRGGRSGSLPSDLLGLLMQALGAALLRKGVSR